MVESRNNLINLLYFTSSHGRALRHPPSLALRRGEPRSSASEGGCRPELRSSGGGLVGVSPMAPKERGETDARVRSYPRHCKRPRAAHRISAVLGSGEEQIRLFSSRAAASHGRRVGGVSSAPWWIEHPTFADGLPIPPIRACKVLVRFAARFSAAFRRY